MHIKSEVLFGGRLPGAVGVQNFVVVHFVDQVFAVGLGHLSFCEIQITNRGLNAGRADRFLFLIEFL